MAVRTKVGTSESAFVLIVLATFGRNMTDYNHYYKGWEQEQERQRRNRERFEAELKGWEEPPPPDLRPKDIPFVMCGTCNSYPTKWACGGWRCSKAQKPIEASDEACERWTPRDDWKLDPPMYVSIHERPRVQKAIQDLYEPVLPSSESQTESERSFVYFIRCGEFVKIGFSTNPHSRRASIATSSPMPVEFIGLIEADLAAERRLHKQFKHLRKKLEWFQLADELRVEIKRLCGSERKWRALLKSCN